LVVINPAPARADTTPVAEPSTSQGTPGRILAAAVQEFVDHGLAGARVDRIAERAGANKQLLYRHFGSKEALFDAAIRAMAQRFDQIRRALPSTLEERLPYYFERATDDQQWVRLLQWEALQCGDDAVVNEAERRAHMERAVEGVRADQAAGLLPAELDAGQLFLSFQALAAHPSAFPQMTRFITGMSPTDPAFRAQRAEFLRALGRRLSAGLPGAGGAGPPDEADPEGGS
jgi:AcrR family transcriptional regulator